MALKDGTPVTTGVFDLDISRPVRQHRAIASHLKRCCDNVIPNVPWAVSLSHDGDFVQNEIHPINGFGCMDRLRNPRLDCGTHFVRNFELRHKLPRAAFIWTLSSFNPQPKPARIT